MLECLFETASEMSTVLTDAMQRVSCSESTGAAAFDQSLPSARGFVSALAGTCLG